MCFCIRRMLLDAVHWCPCSSWKTACPINLHLKWNHRTSDSIIPRIYHWRLICRCWKQIYKWNGRVVLIRKVAYSIYIQHDPNPIFSGLFLMEKVLLLPYPFPQETALLQRLRWEPKFIIWWRSRAIFYFADHP